MQQNSFGVYGITICNCCIPMILGQLENSVMIRVRYKSCDLLDTGAYSHSMISTDIDVTMRILTNTSGQQFCKLTNDYQKKYKI